MRLRYCHLWVFLFLSLGSNFSFGQGFIDFTSGSSTPWQAPGALQQTYAGLGTSLPPVTVSISVTGATSRFINTTPRNDPRGLWLNLDLTSRTQEVILTFVFSDPLLNLSFGIKGIDRELNFGNYQDRVAIEAFDEQNGRLTPDISYNPSFAFLTNGLTPNIKVLSGFNADPFDTTSSRVRFGNTGIKRLTITYGTGPDIRTGSVTPQNIFLTDLAWSNIVPVQLLYLRGKANGSRNELNWATATEINSDYFSVQRSVDLREFAEVGKVKSAGNSRQKIEYNFTDESPLPGVNYYRLRQIDRDGSSEFSKIIAINSQNTDSKFVIYPNPSDGENIRLQFSNLSLEGVRLIDLLGHEIPFEMLSSSNNSLSIKPLRPLQTGLYFVTYSAVGEPRSTQKLWVNR